MNNVSFRGFRSIYSSPIEIRSSNLFRFRFAVRRLEMPHSVLKVFSFMKMLSTCGIIDTTDMCVTVLFCFNHSFRRSRHLIHTHRQEMHHQQLPPLVTLLPRLSLLMCEHSCDKEECYYGVYIRESHCK